MKSLKRKFTITRDAHIITLSHQATSQHPRELWLVINDQNALLSFHHRSGLSVIPCWQFNYEPGAFMPGGVFDPNMAAVRQDNSVRDRQTHARSWGLTIAQVAVSHGSEEPFEYTFARGSRNTGSLVLDTQKDRPFTSWDGAYPDRTVRRRVLRGVVNQRVDDFGDRMFVDLDGWQLVFDPDFESMVPRPRFSPL